jgi:hypothetical protein
VLSVVKFIQNRSAAKVIRAAARAAARAPDLVLPAGTNPAGRIGNGDEIRFQIALANFERVYELITNQKRSLYPKMGIREVVQINPPW